MSEWNIPSPNISPKVKLFPNLIYNHSVGFFDGVASNGFFGAGLFIMFGRDTELKG